jgi:hypothetical protein
MQSASRQVDNAPSSMLEWQQLNSSAALSAAQSQTRKGRRFPRKPLRLPASRVPSASHRQECCVCFLERTCLLLTVGICTLQIFLLSVDETKKGGMSVVSQECLVV